MSSTGKEPTCDSNMRRYFENYILVDIGANLTNRKFSRDLESVIARAKDSGIINYYIFNIHRVKSIYFFVECQQIAHTLFIS